VWEGCSQAVGKPKKALLVTTQRSQCQHLQRFAATKPTNALQQTGTLLLTLEVPQRQKNKTIRNRNRKSTQTQQEKELSNHLRPVKL